jgi:hypothetical protein
MPQQNRPFTIPKATIFALLLFLSVTLSFLLPDNIFAEVPSARGLSARDASLLDLAHSIAELRSEVSAKERELENKNSTERADNLHNQITALESRLAQYEASFVEIATGVDLQEFQQHASNATIAWDKQLQEILRPLINEAQRLTSRPREMDRLRSNISELQQQLAAINQAQSKLESYRVTLPSVSSGVTELSQELDALTTKLKLEEQQVNRQLTIVQQKLDQKLSEKRSIGETVQSVFEVFFRSRGRNLLIALLATGVFWIFFRRSTQFLLRVFDLERPQRRHFLRAFNVAALLLNSVGALLVLLLALYLTGDWVLLLLGCAVLIGLLWTGKHLLPRFFQQTTLLLNLGAVREGERVIYGNLPWRVKTLGLQPILVNHALEPSELRVPIADLLDLRSRPVATGETWFPTQCNDWVLLPEGDPACVVLQTPSQVTVQYLGGIRRIFRADDFFGMALRNLSAGFRISISFGIDYAMQNAIDQGASETFRSAVLSELSKEGIKEPDVTVTVEFEEVKSSSLNFAVIVDCNASLAPRYQKIRRTMQRGCVAACNKERWVIPFNQVQVHMAKEGSQ